MRERNKTSYRLAHWPIWIWVFFLAPGPLIFNLFAQGAARAHLIWFLIVIAGTGIAAISGQLPGVEARPYILRFCEDKPNPLYRRISYTFAWNAVLNFAILNFAGLIVAGATGVWHLRQIYAYAYLPVFFVILCLGAVGVLPRVGGSTKGEGTERRYFYGAVWTVTIAQGLLLFLWKTLPKTHAATNLKLVIFVATLGTLGAASIFGLLPRTRPIMAGDLVTD